MYDVTDDVKGEYRQTEVLTGPDGRRRWSVEHKARIVEETMAPGARVAEVARRWQLCPQQIFAWRREAREAKAVTPVVSAASGFVPIVREDTPAAITRHAVPAPPVIEVKLAGAVVRVVGGQDDGAQLTAVLRAVRASASRS